MEPTGTVDATIAAFQAALATAEQTPLPSASPSPSGEPEPSASGTP